MPHLWIELIPIIYNETVWMLLESGCGVMFQLDLVLVEDLIRLWTNLSHDIIFREVCFSLAQDPSGH